MTGQQQSRYAVEYQAVAGQLPGQDLGWLQQKRNQAFDQFAGTGFPTLRDEEWRYTNVSAIEKKLFTPNLATDSALNIDQFATAILEDVYTVVMHNGRFSPEHSSLDGMPDQFIVCSMVEALQNHADKVQAYLGQAVSDEQHGFIAFNTAWFSDGLFFYAPKQSVLDKPLQFLHIVTDPDLLATTRNLIVLEAMAEAKLIETYIGDDQAYLAANINEVFVGENAGLTLYKLQNDAEKAYHFGGTYVKQAANSRFKHHNFAFGSLLARTDVHTDLDTAAECELNGLYVGVKRQHLDNHTRINHLKPNAVSREQYKGVLDQRARGVFQGRVVVAENAQQTDSDMHNRNLLLSEHAEADTKPQLEIYADDVKCAHGVTVGQLDEKSIFYLQSRCVDEETARNMLTFAFANEMVNKISIPALHDLVLSQLLQRFPQQGVDMGWL